MQEEAEVTFSLLLPLFFPLSCKTTRYRDSSRDSFSTDLHVELYDKNLVRWKMRYAVRSYSSTFEPYLLLKKSSVRACAFAILLRLIHSIHRRNNNEKIILHSVLFGFWLFLKVTSRGRFFAPGESSLTVDDPMNESKILVRSDESQYSS
jgi:hypothetical protein